MNGTNRNRLRAVVSASVAAGTGLLSTAGTAQADVIVASKVSVVKGEAKRGASRSPRTVTAYFKEGYGRLEAGRGRVILYDFQARTVAVLNLVEKTYYEKAIPDLGTPPNLPGRLARFVTTEVTGGIKPAQGAPQTVVGLPTKPYRLLAQVRVQPKQASPVGAGFGGTFRAVGQFQGAASDSVISGRVSEQIRMLLLQQMTGSDGAPWPLVSDLWKLKVIPLKGVVTVTRSGTATAPMPTTLSMEVVTLNQKATLDASLFQVPADYRKVDLPGPGRGDR
ncbi:MAG: hypothetical protein H7Z41_05495 [Cytophagales bacterium]|nr:hypothetical protein [Armatimonadota bacterium]